jgi:hypothetical protein
MTTDSSSRDTPVNPAITAHVLAVQHGGDGVVMAELDAAPTAQVLPQWRASAPRRMGG